MNKRILILITLLAVLFVAGCHKAENKEAETAQPAASKPAASPLTGFAADLQFIKNGQYTYVYVFSRKDGKPLKPEDSQYLRTNAPQVVDWAAQNGTKAVAGTNFNLEEGNMAALKKRFVVEDYSAK
jgi:hypothetical protein